MAVEKTELEIYLKDYASSPAKKIINSFLDLQKSSLGLNKVEQSFTRMGTSMLMATQGVDGLMNAFRGLAQWSQKTVETQTKLQQTFGLIATKVTDDSLKAFAQNSLKVDLDVTDAQQKSKVLSQYLRSVKKDAREWALGVGDFAQVVPMSEDQYAQQMKQLLSSGLSASEATLATKYSAVMSKALESTHADAAYDMAKIYNNIKSATPAGGLFDTEETLKNITSTFDYMDNNFQFKIGKNAVSQIKKTLAVGLSRGFSFEEQAMGAGLMASSGFEGGMGDTALKEFLGRMTIARDKAQKAGLQFSYSFGDSLPTVLKNLNKATEGMDKLSKQDFLRDAFGERGLQAALLLGEKAGEIEKHLANAKKHGEGLGGAFKSAFARSGDYSTSLNMLNNQLAVFAGDVGVYTTGIRWMFTDAIKGSISFLGYLEMYDTGIGGFVASGISKFLTFGGVITAFGADFMTTLAPAVSFLGSLTLAIQGLATALPLLKTGFLSVASSIWSVITSTIQLGIASSIAMYKNIALWVAMQIGAMQAALPVWAASFPILAIALAVLAIIAALGALWYYWDEIWGWIKSSISGLWGMFDNLMGSIFGGVWEGIKAFFKWIIDKIRWVYNLIGNLFGYYYDGEKQVKASPSDEEGAYDFKSGVGNSLSGGSGKKAKGTTLPAGYAYQINNRLNSNLVGSVLGASNPASSLGNSSYPAEDEIDVLRRIETIGKDIKTILSGLVGTDSGAGLAIGSGNTYIEKVEMPQVQEISDLSRLYQLLAQAIRKS